MHHGEFRDDRSREDDFSYGGWNRHPIGHPDGEFLVIARSGRADLIGDDAG
jgi:hypothetical protein